MHILIAISGYVIKMMAPALFGGLICLLATPLRRKRLAAKGLADTLPHILWLAVFFAFLAGLFALIVLPSGRPTGEMHYNLIPFQILRDTATEVQNGNFMGLTISFLGNVVMFLPIGLLPALLWRDISWKKGILIGTLCSLGIEVCQLPMGRSADVDDLILNTVGAALGFGIYRLLFRWKSSWCNSCKVISKTEEEPS